MSKSGQKMAKRILGYIEAFPDAFDMNTWVGDLYTVEQTGSVCGTTLCAAGTAVYLDSGVKGLIETWHAEGNGGQTFEQRGRDLLGLNRSESSTLFYTRNETAKDALKALAKGKRRKFRRILDLDPDTGFSRW